jgi:MPBQ/MSBQ methyltransferase
VIARARSSLVCTIAAMDPAVRDLFDGMASAYDDDFEPWYAHLYAVLHAIVGAELDAAPEARRRALDAGCGTGLQSRLFADRGWQPYGIDIAGALMRIARERVPGAALAYATVEALPFADGAFDAIACCGSTLSFVDDPGRALAEMGRVLRPGGRLFLECEHRPSLDLGWAVLSAVTGDALRYHTPLGDAWRALVARRSVRLAYPGYGLLNLFTTRDLHAMLRAAGLVPRREWGLHSITNVLPSTVLHRPRLSQPFAAIYRALCRLDTALAPTAVGRAFANSLLIVAERVQSAA